MVCFSLVVSFNYFPSLFFFMPSWYLSCLLCNQFIRFYLVLYLVPAPGPSITNIGQNPSTSPRNFLNFSFLVSLSKKVAFFWVDGNGVND